MSVIEVFPFPLPPDTPGSWEVVGEDVSEVVVGRDTLEKVSMEFAVDASSGDILGYNSIPFDWEKVGDPAVQFVVADMGHLYGLSHGDSIWRRVSGESWTWIRGNTSEIVGSPGGLYAVDSVSHDLHAYDWVGDDWTRIGGPGTLFVSGLAGHLYALGTDGTGVWRYDGTPMAWTKIGVGFDHLVAGGTRLSVR